MTWLGRATAALLVVVLTVDVGVVVDDANRAWPETSTEEWRPRRPSPAAPSRDFLRRYVASDGRVVRRDQGGDTVSEGQAYAMLAAVVADDRRTFDRVWGWTTAHLQRADALLSWHWADGRVVDAEPATDADLDAAWALALAGRRWSVDRYVEDASRLARAVERAETSTLPDGRPVLVPGPWARARAQRGDGLVLNPSYSSPVGEAVLVAAGHLPAPASRARLASMRAILTSLVEDGELPPDWAEVASDGTVRSVAGPDDPSAGRYGWDAVRVPLRLAASCDREDRALAARLAPALRAGAGRDVMGEHPARLVAAASASAAAGDADAARELLDRAARAQAGSPTYYGGALVALGRALLTTDVLGGCPPA